MKEKIAHAVGWFFIAICCALIAIHGYFAFFSEHPPYNITKGHIEVGVIGFILFFAAIHLLGYEPKKPTNSPE